MWSRNRLLGALLALAVCSPAFGQGIVVPNTFSNGTTADADQVNANFAALVNNALNRAGGIMSGSLQTIDVLPVTTDVSDIGTNLKKYRDGWFSRNVAIGGTLAVTGAATLSSTLASGTHTITGGLTTTTAVTIGSATPGTTLGIGISPTRQVHISGAGQTVSNLTDAGATGGTLYVQDSGSAANNGGAILFGASQGFFAAIKALIADGTPNTVGYLSFSTRAAIGNTALTEAMRIQPSGGLTIGTTTDGGAGSIVYQGAEVIGGVVTGSIGATTNDYAPAGIATAKVLKVVPTGSSQALTGIAAQNGHILIIMNGNAAGGFDLVIAHRTTSAAANQFAVRGGANITLQPGTSATAYYDVVSAIWSVH